MNPPILTGIAPLADLYDIFVVDLWGTLHNGVAAYPGAMDALERLLRAGKQVALLSNAPRRAALAEQTLLRMGFAPHLYATLLTSGEAVHASLRDRPDDWHRRLGGPCWHLGPARDRSVFEGLALELLDRPDGAGFCVATGIDRDDDTLDQYRPMLDRGLALGLPFICANPDIVVPVGDRLVLCAGAFARYYALRGGAAFWHGKPHRPIYDRLFAALAVLGGPVDPGRAVMIGDGLPTDIAGAAAAGIAGALVTGGIHLEALGGSWGEPPGAGALASLLADAPARPDWILPRFAW